VGLGVFIIIQINSQKEETE